jgi:hypothetical protein
VLTRQPAPCASLSTLLCTSVSLSVRSPMPPLFDVGAELAAAALAQLTADTTHGIDNVAQCAAAGAVKPLVALLESQSVEAAAAAWKAAAVLADMTRHSAANQKEVVSGGGIEPLIALLSSGHNAEAKAEAARALWSLSTSGQEERTAIAEAGAIAPLVEMLEMRTPRPLAKAAGALSGLTHEHPTNQDAVTAAGGIYLLVELIGTGRMRASDVPVTNRWTRDQARALWEDVQANAAAALSQLARGHIVNQTAISEAGAIHPLIRLLSLDTTSSDDEGPINVPSNEEAARGPLPPHTPPPTTCPPPRRHLFQRRTHLFQAHAATSASDPESLCVRSHLVALRGPFRQPDCGGQGGWHVPCSRGVNAGSAQLTPPPPTVIRLSSRLTDRRSLHCLARGANWRRRMLPAHWPPSRPKTSRMVNASTPQRLLDRATLHSRLVTCLCPCVLPPHELVLWMGCVHVRACRGGDCDDARRPAQGRGPSREGSTRDFAARRRVALESRRSREGGRHSAARGASSQRRGRDEGDGR